MFVRAVGRLRFCPHRRHLLHVSLCFLLHIRLARMRTPWLKWSKMFPFSGCQHIYPAHSRAKTLHIGLHIGTFGIHTFSGFDV